MSVVVFFILVFFSVLLLVFCCLLFIVMHFRCWISVLQGTEQSSSSEIVVCVFSLFEKWERAQLPNTEPIDNKRKRVHFVSMFVHFICCICSARFVCLLFFVLCLFICFSCINLLYHLMLNGMREKSNFLIWTSFWAKLMRMFWAADTLCHNKELLMSS